MRTILHISLGEDSHEATIELCPKDDFMPLLAYSLHTLAEQNNLFRAVLASAFEALCESQPEVYRKLQAHFDNHSAEPAIAVNPNPTKS